MGKLITIGQTLLDGLKWLMEGNNWLFLTPLVLICGYVFIQMARKKKLLIFIWYLATISILSVMLELALGAWEAMIFALIFIIGYFIIFIPYFFRGVHIGKKADTRLLIAEQNDQINAKSSELRKLIYVACNYGYCSLEFSLEQSNRWLNPFYLDERLLFCLVLGSEYTI